MKKILKFIKRLIIGIFLVLYFSVAILVSSLLLNKNDYGITEFDNKQFILVDEAMAGKTFKEGQLVIVKKVNFKDIKSGDEVFIYSKNDDNTIKVIVAEVDEAVTEADNYKYITIKNDGTSWGEKFIAGKADAVYDDWGKYISFITSKWIFFILLIVPCFFILLYEIYLIVITIKYGDEEEEEEIAKQIDVATINKEKEEDLVPLQVPGFNIPEEVKPKEEPKVPAFMESFAAQNVVREVETETIPLKELEKERNVPDIDIEDSIIELPKKEEIRIAPPVAPKTFLQAPKVNYNNFQKMESPRTEPDYGKNEDVQYSRYDRTLDNKYVEPKEEKKESNEDVQAKLDALLKEVSRLKDELNNK